MGSVGLDPQYICLQTICGISVWSIINKRSMMTIKYKVRYLESYYYYYKLFYPLIRLSVRHHQLEINEVNSCSMVT